MHLSEKKVLLIFSGYNPRAVIAFLRTLVQNKIENYAIVASSKRDMIFKTDYKNKVIYTRKKKQLDLEEFCYLVNYVCKETKMEKVVIVPSTEALNRFVLRNRVYLEQHNCIIPLVNESLYTTISDKESFCKLCKKHSLLIPGEVALGDEYCMPLVAKPRKYVSSGGNTFSPVLIQSEMEYKYFLSNYDTEDFVFQEFVEGESYYLLYYFSNNGEVYHLSQKNLLQQPGGKSIIAACCSKIHLEEISKQYEEMFKKIGFYGLVMVELRKNKFGYYMIEANPRLWGPSQLFCDSGYNFFEYFLYDYNFLNNIPENCINYQVKYFWSGGMQGTLLEDKECVRHLDNDNIIVNCWKEFIKCDMYCRKDTMQIYEYELKGEERWIKSIN